MKGLAIVAVCLAAYMVLGVIAAWIAVWAWERRHPPGGTDTHPDP